MGDMKYLIRYNGEFVAATKYFFEAKLVYDNLVERGKLTESVYPFKVVMTFGNQIDREYQTPKAPTREDVEAMVKEYGR